MTLAKTAVERWEHDKMVLASRGMGAILTSFTRWNPALLREIIKEMDSYVDVLEESIANRSTNNPGGGADGNP